MPKPQPTYTVFEAISLMAKMDLEGLDMCRTLFSEEHSCYSLFDYMRLTHLHAYLVEKEKKD